MTTSAQDGGVDRAGLAAGLAAYGMWGLVPLYFKAVAAVPALEILAHRVVWSVLVLGFILLARQGFGQVVVAFRDRRTLGVLAITTALIATNWYLFIYAVATERVLEASLGYFINPLVNVLLGVVVLRERLSRLATVSVALAAVAVLWLTLRTGTLPWIALCLAFSFGFYGLLRKTARVGAVAGLWIETAFLVPVGLVFLAWWWRTDVLWFGAHGTTMDALLVASGLVTAIPLVCFAVGARRLPLSTMGFLQYLAPTGHFAIAVFVFGETLDIGRLGAFAVIWSALVLYTADLVITARGRRRAPATPRPGSGSTPPPARSR
jgi:chloramphenicol-sensitive protein RarD